MRKKKTYLFFWAVLVSAFTFIFSCTAALTHPAAVKDTETIKNVASVKHLELDINDLTIGSKVEDTVLAGTRKTNLANEKHKYSIIPLPYPNKNTDILNLTLTLYDKTELSTKGFFLVNGYFSDSEVVIENIVQSDPQQDAVKNDGNVENNLHKSLNSFFNPQDDQILGTTEIFDRLLDFSFKLREPRNSRSLFNIARAETQIGKEIYDALVKIDLNNAEIIPSQREFMFNSNLHGAVKKNGCEYDKAKLYNKVEIDYAGEKKHFAFWADDSTYTDEVKHKVYDNIKTFIGILDNTDNAKSLYRLLYQVNNSHIWGEHRLGLAVAASDSIINIAIGGVHKEGLLGFVGTAGFLSPQIFTEEICGEKKLEPTVYMNEDFVTAERNLADPTSVFTTLVHEIQHIFTYYTHMIVRSNSVFAISNNKPNRWVNELISVSMEYLFGYKISELINSKVATDPQVVSQYKNYFDNRYMMTNGSFVNALVLSSLISNDKVTSGTYFIAFLLASYLVQNYGVEAIENLVRTTAKGRDALFRAVKNTTKYDRYGIYKPKNAEELLLAFFISLFTADVMEDKTSAMSSPYKMFAPNPQSNPPIQFKDADLVYVEFEKYQYAGVPLYIPSINMSATPHNHTNERLQSRIVFQIGVDQMLVLDFNDLWTNGRGSRIFPPRYARYIDDKKIVMSGGQHSVMYLGGKIRKERKDSRFNGEGLYTGFFINDEDKLMLKLQLPKGTMSALVIVEYL